MSRHSIDWTLQAEREKQNQDFLDKINEIDTKEDEDGEIWIKYEEVLDIAQEVICG